MQTLEEQLSSIASFNIASQLLRRDSLREANEHLHHINVNILSRWCVFYPVSYLVLFDQRSDNLAQCLVSMLENVVALSLHRVSVLMCRYRNIDFSAIVDMSLVQYTSRIDDELKNIIFSDSCSHLQQRVIEAVAEVVDDCWAKKNDVKKIAVIKDFWDVDSSMNDEWWRIDEKLLSMRSENFCLVEVDRAVIFAVKEQASEYQPCYLSKRERE